MLLQRIKEWFYHVSFWLITGRKMTKNAFFFKNLHVWMGLITRKAKIVQYLSNFSPNSSSGLLATTVQTNIHRATISRLSTDISNSFLWLSTDYRPTTGIHRVSIECRPIQHSWHQHCKLQLKIGSMHGNFWEVQSGEGRWMCFPYLRISGCYFPTATKLFDRYFHISLMCRLNIKWVQRTQQHPLSGLFILYDFL